MSLTRYLFIAAAVLFIAFSSCKKDVDIPPPPVDPDPPPAFTDTLLTLAGKDFILGNRERKIPDTFILHFSKAIQLEHLLFKEEYCLPEIKFELTPDRRQVRFYNFFCNGLGGNYPFEFRVADDKGNHLTDSVRFDGSAYTVMIPGRINSFRLSDDNAFAWVCTRQPNQLLKVDVNTGTILSTFDLPFIPMSTAWNPFNNRLYVIRSYEDFVFPNNLYIINPSSGQIEKTIPVLPDAYEHHQHPEIYAYQVEFGSNGLGVILIGSWGTSALRWKMLDSRVADSIYIHPAWMELTTGNGNTRFSGFKTAHTNFDKSRILMLELYGSTRLGLIDCSTGALTEYEPPGAAMNYNNFVVPNRLNGDIYFANIRSQYITAGNKVLGHISEFDNRFVPSADFTYRQGEKNIVYFVNDNQLFVLDYNKRETLMSCNLKFDLQDVRSTTDGKFILMRAEHALHIFSTDPFYRHL